MPAFRLPELGESVVYVSYREASLFMLVVEINIIFPFRILQFCYFDLSNAFDAVQRKFLDYFSSFMGKTII